MEATKKFSSPSEIFAMKGQRKLMERTKKSDQTNTQFELESNNRIQGFQSMLTQLEANDSIESLCVHTSNSLHLYNPHDMQSDLAVTIPSTDQSIARAGQTRLRLTKLTELGKLG